VQGGGGEGSEAAAGGGDASESGGECQARGAAEWCRRGEGQVE